MIRTKLLCSTILSGLLGYALLPAPAVAADLPQAAVETTSFVDLPAVDGFNGKVSAFGGWSRGRDGLGLDGGRFGGEGSISSPIGHRFGVQIDGAAQSRDGVFQGDVAGHLFWRDPAFALFGAYVAYSHLDKSGGLALGRAGGEFAGYFGRFTLEGIAGVEGGKSKNISATRRYEPDTRFFDQVNLAWYPTDDMKVYAGHRYGGGLHAAAAGLEVLLPSRTGTAVSAFGEGRLGEDHYRQVWGGVRVYFGGSDKTLIRRHREDDPTVWNDPLPLAKSVKDRVEDVIASPPPPPPP